MKVLIAGCDGLLGQNLLQTRRAAGSTLVGLARHAEPALPGLLSAYHALDIAEPATWEFVRREVRPDFIINAAAWTDVDGCERDPARCERVNRDAVRLMAETGIPVVQVSTDYVFDGEAGPYSEEDPLHPVNVYGRAKLESESFALADPRGLVVRTLWLWGQGKGAKKSFTEFVRETLSEGKPVRAVTDQWGNPTSARDLALAIWALIDAGRSGVYHAAGKEWMSRHDWAVKVAEFHGLDASLVQPAVSSDLRFDAARPLRSGLNGDKLARDTGFRLRGLEEQLREP
jgi:dTDP-4-dehydrorhamnose reductase